MTKFKAETDARRAANLSFAALLFALFGWANLEVLLCTTRAGIRGQLLTAVLGLCLSTLAYRRCQFWRAHLALSGHVARPEARSAARNIGTGSALAVAGFVLAYSMRTGFVTATAIGAAIFTFIPWFRSGFCRQYFLVSLGLLVAGGLPILIIAAEQEHPVILLAHTWVLWTLGTGLVLSALWSQRSADHPPGQPQAEPEVDQSGM